MLTNVFIPSYNHARFIAQRIDTVLGQVEASLSLRIFDDCSSDESLSIIEAYRGRKLLDGIHSSREPSGSPFGRWRDFLDHINGDYVWIAESDDYSDRRFLSAAYDAFNKFPHVGVVIAKSWLCDDLGARQGEARDHMDSDIRPIGKMGALSVYDGMELLDKEFSVRNIFPNVSAALFRSSVFKGAYTDDVVEFRYLGDWFLYQRILSKFNVCVIDERLNYWRTHRHTTRNGNKPLKDWVRLLSERLRVSSQNSRLVGRNRTLSDTHLFDVFSRMRARMDLQENLKPLMSALSSSAEKFYIYGAGSIGEQLYEELRARSLDSRVLCFLDRRAIEDEPCSFCGVEVKSPSLLECETGGGLVVVASIEFLEQIVTFVKACNRHIKILRLDGMEV